ncbi:hypothetical protein COLO4_00573 [Corchorus olitorius]|uniref:Uncharacterized protein n=1 Tax=Corchorus olitorius TaxID=93759 RepID=A0A1R3L3M6_9ROSI|nr:hypothetical protein COLO4_00573 [Corchorus olitorius]
MNGCAAGYGPISAIYSSGLVLRQCMSRTIRRRRWRYPTKSSS